MKIENKTRKTKSTVQDLDNICDNPCVVATTRHSRTNDLTASKALSRAIK